MHFFESGIMPDHQLLNEDADDASLYFAGEDDFLLFETDVLSILGREIDWEENELCRSPDDSSSDCSSIYEDAESDLKKDMEYGISTHLLPRIGMDDSELFQEEPHQETPQPFRVTTDFFNGIKEVWGWSKQNLQLVGNLLGVVEGVASHVAQAAGTSLNDLESNVLAPHLQLLDQSLCDVSQFWLDMSAHIVHETQSILQQFFARLIHKRITYVSCKPSNEWAALTGKEIVTTIPDSPSTVTESTASPSLTSETFFWYDDYEEGEWESLLDRGMPPNDCGGRATMTRRHIIEPDLWLSEAYQGDEW